MCNNSLIYMITTTTSDVVANGIIPLTTIARRRGSSIQNGTNSVILNSAGYYKVSATLTFTAPEAGDVSVSVLKNSVGVSGLTASTTITTATTEVRSLTITGVVRVYCNDGIATLSLVNTGVGITLSNVSFDVEYLG